MISRSAGKPEDAVSVAKRANRAASSVTTVLLLLSGNEIVSSGMLLPDSSETKL